MPGEGHRAKGVDECAGSIAQDLQVGKFRLPLAGGLLEDELAVAKYLDLRRFRIEVLALDRLQSIFERVDERQVLRLVIRDALAELEPLDAWRRVANGELIAAVATAGVSERATIEDDMDRQRGSFRDRALRSGGFQSGRRGSSGVCGAAGFGGPSSHDPGVAAGAGGEVSPFVGGKMRFSSAGAAVSSGDAAAAAANGEVAGFIGAGPDGGACRTMRGPAAGGSSWMLRCSSRVTSELTRRNSPTTRPS